jgi:hypothetical protein
MSLADIRVSFVGQMAINTSDIGVGMTTFGPVGKNSRVFLLMTFETGLRLLGHTAFQTKIRADARNGIV